MVSYLTDQVQLNLHLYFIDISHLIGIKTRNPSADMVRLCVNIQFQVKPLSTGTRLSQTKIIFFKNACVDPPRCVPSLESLAQV